MFDYSDEIIKDNLVRGIADPEIMSNLPGDPKTDRTLEETVSFIAQEEQGKATKTAVGDTVGAMCATRTNSKQSLAPGRRCWACGGSAHGQKNDCKARARYYEAWTFTCSKCTTKGHFTKNCSKCTTCGEWGHHDSSSRAFVKGMAHKKIVGSNNFSAQFIKIISHYKKIGYKINVLQQTACLVVNPITVGNFAFLFNCTPVGRSSDSMMVPT